jgi:hypothetical protein
VRALQILNALENNMPPKDATSQSNGFNHPITISAGGYWIDPQGNQWRLVPMMCSACQMKWAAGRAKQWTDENLSQMLRLEYAMGYEAMMRLAPPPPLSAVD